MKIGPGLDPSLRNNPSLRISWSVNDEIGDYETLSRSSLKKNVTINIKIYSGYIHRVSKNCAFLFSSELRQISMNFNNFW